MIVQQVLAAAAPSHAYDIVLGAVGSILMFLLAILIRVINKMSEGFKQRMDSLGATLNELYIVVCGNPKVDGDRGLAGKLNGHERRITETEGTVEDLKRLLMPRYGGPFGPSESK